MDARPIIVRRKRAAAHAAGSHGGAWKIAYADFMTAMMAFFLVMWLLLISSKEQLAGIADQFKMPLKAALTGGNRSSTSSSVIPGGGPDPVRSEPGEVQQEQGDDDGQRLENLKRRLDDIVDKNPDLKELRPQLKIDITPDGLRIQIVDTQNRPMFELASARVLPHMRLILQHIGPVLNELPNKITLAGHTDATLYANGGRSYGNWELSADRANASRRELIAGGMREERVLRVMGLAASTPLNPTDATDPMNRRISIVVLNHGAQSRIEREMAAGGSGNGAPAAPVSFDARQPAAQRPLPRPRPVAGL
jgi:chemotaxis protein MotB